MGLRKFRERVAVQSSIVMRGTEAAPTTRGFLNVSGVITPTSDGINAASAVQINLAASRLRVPYQGTSVGTASPGFGTANTGQQLVGFLAGSAQIGWVINGTVYTMQWAAAGGTPIVVANAAGA